MFKIGDTVRFKRQYCKEDARHCFTVVQLSSLAPNGKVVRVQWGGRMYWLRTFKLELVKDNSPIAG